MTFRINKKFTTYLAVLCLSMLALSGCAAEQNNQQQPEQTGNQSDTAVKASLQLSLDEYPRMDGSTANLPMMAEIMS